MKTLVEMVVGHVATNYGYFQVPIHGFVVPISMSVLVEDLVVYDELETYAKHVSIQENEYVVHNGGDSLKQRNMRGSSVKVKVKK